MRASTSRVLVVLALLAASPPAPAEVSWGGNLGLSLNRDDQWGGGSHSGRSVYWFAGELHLDAGLFTPGTLDLSGTASYRGYRAIGGSASDALNFQLRLLALARTPVRLSASAGRTTVDFTADRDGGRVGSTRIDGLSGSTSFSLPGYPAVSATVRNVVTNNRSTGAPTVKSDSTSINAEVSQSLEAANYALTYSTSRTSGDYAETNYRDHIAQLRAHVELATSVTAQASVAYNLREPTLVSPLNPRLDNQFVSVGSQWTSAPGRTGNVSYTYANSLFEAPGSELRQSISHSVGAQGIRRLSEQLSMDLSLGGQATQVRVGATEQQATGEHVGAGLHWTGQAGPYLTRAVVNGSFGGFQPSSGPDTGAWALSASGNVAREIGTWTTGAALNASHDRSTGAMAGDRTRLTGTLTAAGSPLGWGFNSQLNAGYRRAQSPSFGANRQFNVRFDAQAARRGYILSLNGGSTDDLSEVLAPGAPPGAALIPASFNTQSRYVVASANIPTFSRLFLTVLGRHVTVSSPGRPSQWESGLSVSVGYSIGAFSFSLFDSVTTQGSSTGTQNLLFLTVMRPFGR